MPALRSYRTDTRKAFSLRGKNRPPAQTKSSFGNTFPGIMGEVSLGTLFVMKRLLHWLSAASVAAVVVLAANNAVGASDKQTLDPAQNTSGNGPDVLAQNATPKEAKSSTRAKVNVDSQGVILKGYDVVAYFKQGKPAKGNPAIESAYQGATYLFASSADKADFDKDPARYAPKYGAFCSYGVANGVIADIEGPEAFAVYNGKLYLCGNQGALKGFKSNIDSNIEKADTNWRQLTGS